MNDMTTSNLETCARNARRGDAVPAPPVPR